MAAPASATRSPGSPRASTPTPAPAPAAPGRRASSSPRARGRARPAAAPADARTPMLGRFSAALAKWVLPTAPAAGSGGRPRPRRVQAPAAGPQAPAEKEDAPGKTPARAPTTPAADPAFQQAKRQVRVEARRQRSHEPADKKRSEAEKASAMTETEQVQQSSKEVTAADMERVGAAQQSAGKRFSAEGFKTELVTRIAKKRPKTEDEAKDLAKNPPLEHFEQDFSKNVAQEQGKVTGPLEEKAARPPTGGSVEKPFFEVPKAAVPRAPAPVDARLAAPKPKTDAEISHQKDIDDIDGAMRKNRLADDQLAESREPKFVQTLNVKNEARRQAAEAPSVYRAKEAAVLTAAQGAAGKTLIANLGAMRAKHIGAGGQVYGSQGKTETQTEKRQREIKSTIDGLYDDTVKAVGGILAAMVTQVKEDFARTLKEKTDDFNAEVRRRISDYYGDWRIDDELFGPDDIVVNEDGSTRAMTPEERFGIKKQRTINPDVYKIFVEEKDRFVEAMNGALDAIAANVEAGLTAAHTRIVLGETAITVFKAGLKGSELEYAEQLEQDVKMKFENLEASIDDAREDLLQTLADQYTETVDGLEKSFNEINDELKKSWLDRAIEFVETVGKTIFQLADLLLTILSRMARLIWDIVKHPIRFFETLVKGLMQGLGDFISNIGENLKEGFWTWITGASSAKGIHLSSGSGPAVLFDLVLQVLSLQPADLRAIAEKVLGRETMELIDKGLAIGEKVLEPVVILFTKGPGALWEYLKETLADMVSSTFDRIRESVFNTFVEKGLKWIAGFFIPGGGFVKVVKAVFAAFQFVVENLDRIRAFFDSVFDSMEAAVEGRTDGVAAKIVTGLKLGVVLALDFLAKQLGVGKIVDGVHKVIHALRTPIVSAIEWLLNKVKPFVTKVVHGASNLARKATSRALGGDPNSPPEQRLRNGLREGAQAVNRLSGSRIGIAVINHVLGAIRLRHNLLSLQAEARGERWAVVGEVNPRGEEMTEKRVEHGTRQKDGFATKVTYGPVNDLGFGTKMTANPVGPGHPGGTTVSEKLRLELRLGSADEIEAIGRRQGRYRLGHLLNHHIGGPGNDWRNLTPITPSANTNHLAAVERDVKKLVLDHECWVWYEVQADYSGPAPTPPKRVHPFETKFARRLNWSYKAKKPNDKGDRLVDEDKATIHSIPTSGKGSVPSISDGYPD